MCEGSEEYLDKVTAYFNKIAEEYDKKQIDEILSCDELYYYVRDRIEWYYIEKYLPKKGIVLDVAGGTGRLTIPIALRGLKVVLIDISEGMLKVAREKVKEHGLEDKVIIKEAIFIR